MINENIGIIGGVGPYAGIELQKAILRNTPAGCDQDYPPVINISAPHKITDRTDFILGKASENPAYAIVEQIKSLHAFGARFIGIPCNTVHADEIFSVIISGIQDLDGIVLVNMIHETFIEIKNNLHGVKRIGVLATKGSYKSEVFRKYGTRHHCDVIIPESETLQEDIHSSIYDNEFGIKVKGLLTDRAKRKLDRAFDYYENINIETVIIGCTELSVVFQERKYKNITLIDPIDVLARKLIYHYQTRLNR